MTSVTPPAFQMRKVGEQLKEVKTRLLEFSQQLEGLADGDLKKRLEPIKGRLMQCETKVAVIGQVKAGKSSLINCLIRKPDFLPSDINPWTSIVTQLHFGHPSGKDSGAIFRFFDEEQWYQLATRGGRLGELTEGLLEDYKSEQLFDQVDAMRERAKLRLGGKFEAMLGQSHQFNTISGDIMARYVCAGDAPEEQIVRPVAGRFSDITRTAEVFFEQDPFSCPICIMDTPGINDPLLIREEITQQSLETADFFVVVLSAHQSLTRVDLRLIRLLKALNQDQMVVFVNRVDEINASASELDELRKRIHRQLQQELNGKDVAVILGSSAWADYALNENDEYLEPDRLREFINSRGLAKQVRDLAPIDSPDAKTRAEAYVASGLGQLESALSDMIYHKAVATDLIGAATDLANISRQAAEQAQARIDALEGEATGAKPVLTPQEKDKLIEETREKIVSAFQMLKSDINEASENLEEELVATVSSFSDQQFDVIKTGIRGLKRGESYHCDMDPLRNALQEEYAVGYEKIRNDLVDEVVVFNGSLGSGFNKKVRKHMRSVKAKSWFLATLLPKTDALFRTVSLDLTTSWLDGFRGFPESKIKLATDTIREQFGAICKEMVAKGQLELDVALNRLAGEFTEDISQHLNALAGQSADGKLHPNSEAKTLQQALVETGNDLKIAGKLVEDLEDMKSTLESESVGQ